MTINISIQNKQVIKIFTLAVAFTIGVFALIKMYDALMMLVVAFFIALALNPAVNFITRYLPGKRRGPAIALVIVAHLAVLAFLLGSIIPPVIRETSYFLETLPETVNNSFYRSERVQNFVERYQLQDEIDTSIESSKSWLTEYSQDVVSSAGRIGSSLYTVVTVLVLAILMLTGGSKLINRFADIAYRDKTLRARHEIVAGKMYDAVTGYVIGQVSVAFVAALVALGVLMLLSIPYSLPLAGIVFVFGLIPLIGNTLAAILVVISTVVLKDFTSALILLAFFILYQQVENVTLQPIVQGKTTNLPPLVIFASVILGVALVGPIGGLLAIPAAGCAKVLLLDYFEHRDDLKPDDSPIKLATKIKNKFTKKSSTAS